MKRIYNFRFISFQFLSFSFQISLISLFILFQFLLKFPLISFHVLSISFKSFHFLSLPFISFQFPVNILSFCFLSISDKMLLSFLFKFLLFPSISFQIPFKFLLWHLCPFFFPHKFPFLSISSQIVFISISNSFSCPVISFQMIRINLLGYLAFGRSLYRFTWFLHGLHPKNSYIKNCVQTLLQVSQMHFLTQIARLHAKLTNKQGSKLMPTKQQ